MLKSSLDQEQIRFDTISDYIEGKVEAYLYVPRNSNPVANSDSWEFHIVNSSPVDPETTRNQSVRQYVGQTLEEDLLSAVFFAELQLAFLMFVRSVFT